MQTEGDVVLFFEYLLDEFYDSHLILNTNINASYRLYSPIYASLINGRVVITSVWQSQLNPIGENIVGAQINAINGLDMDHAIEQFPVHCCNKDSLAVRQWIVNKILAGKYYQPRVLSLQLSDGRNVEYDLDKMSIKSSETLLTSRIENEIGIIRFNNSLDNDALIQEFDAALDEFM